MTMCPQSNYIPHILKSCLVLHTSDLSKAGNDGKPLAESIKSTFISNIMTMYQVLSKICEMYTIENTRDTRLWAKPAGSDWTLSMSS